jgi:hypothetical protein
LTVNAVAPTPPNLTADAPVNPLPETVTDVPPAAGPDEGETRDTARPDATYVNRSAALALLVPFAVVTVMSTVPTPGGEIAAIDPSPNTENELALAPPNLTADAPVNPEPEIATEVPPVAGPEDGLTPVTTGPGAMYANRSAGVVGLVPAVVVTVTSTVPEPGGEIAKIDPSPNTTNELVVTAPNDTPMAPVNPDPEIATRVPPDAGPEDGLTPDTTGPGT